jgi:transposase
MTVGHDGSLCGSTEEVPDRGAGVGGPLYFESEPRPVVRRLAEQLGTHHEALRTWIRQAQADRGERTDQPPTADVEELRRLRKENAEMRSSQ